MRRSLVCGIVCTFALSTPFVFAGGQEAAPWKEGIPVRTNPFFAPSTLPFHAPPFDRIKDSDYKPAIEEGMKQQLAEVDAIADRAPGRRPSRTPWWPWSDPARS